MEEHIVVVGGGVGGLAASLALARQGFRVTLLERDPLPATADAEEAFVAERRGAPQVHQTHGFLARILRELKARFPDVLEQLLAAGCTTFPMHTAGDPQPGDEDLSVLIVRRTTFEWVLRQAVVAEPAVRIRTGVGVAGLVVAGDGGLPRVVGVRTDEGEIVDADVVVTSTGRRGAVPAWLGAAGVEVPETVVESGLMYLSRWYRLPPGHLADMDPKLRRIDPEPVARPPQGLAGQQACSVDSGGRGAGGGSIGHRLGGDLGFVKYLAVPGDGDTLSITLAIKPDDAELRSALSDPAGFEHACRVLPGPDQFFAAGPLEPVGGVRPMTGLLNRLRSFVDADGRPVVLGFHAIGDAHTCTNPLYGRGCSIAVVQAGLLADALTATGDSVERSRRYEEASAREIEPWYHVSVQMDRAGSDPNGLGASGDAQGASPFGGDAKALGAVFVAALTDPVLGRAFARFGNMLSTPQALFSDPAVLARIADVVQRPDDFPIPPREGPTRGELLDQLANCAA